MPDASDQPGLHGKVALVIGATQGSGLGIAQRLVGIDTSSVHEELPFPGFEQ